ncbi:mobilization protein MobS [Psychrobacter phenylpyruvicus]|uniref:mobilization protein MobS n=1 Tax=Psychrobacter phenylpyruvicus TaxID=29432 RepID=UPI000A7DCEAE|nr:mobilization protein MobS [Psychrobacter phenylpyruvicus]
MSLLTNNELKEQQKINELEQKIKREKEKLDKKLTHQKIVLGAFFLDMLEKNAVDGLKKYTAENLSDFLTRKSDKEAFEAFIDSLKDEPKDEELDKDEEETDDEISRQSQYQHNL